MLRSSLRRALCAASLCALACAESGGAWAQVASSAPVEGPAGVEVPTVKVPASAAPASPSNSTKKAATVDIEGPQSSGQNTKAPTAEQKTSTPIAAAAPASSGSGPAPAAGGTADPAASAVAPTGEATPVREVASSVTIITAKQIEAEQRRTLPDVLKGVPGLDVVQTGGVGGQTSVFLRGTNSNHVKVLIDGIEVSDPSTTNRTFDFSQMPAADIERVEVLRGPQSGLYGADALGGVILIYTKKGNGPPKVTATVEGGSFGTFNQSTSVSGGTDKFNYAASIAHLNSQNIPVTPPGLLAPGERALDNRYDNWTYSGRLGIAVSKDVTVNLIARYTEAELRFIGTAYDPVTFAAMPASQYSRLNTQDFQSRAEVVWSALGDRLVSTFGVNYTDHLTQSQSPGYDPSNYEGDRVKLDWRSVAKVAPGITVIVGADHQDEELQTAGLIAREANDGGFVELQTELVRNFFVTANVRYDDNENFGGHTTWRVAPAYVIEATGTKLKASVGTGFKAPSLSQRFQDFPPDYFANRALRPEESTGWDMGFEQPLFGDRARFGATYFSNDLTNLIQTIETGQYYYGYGFPDPITTLGNINRAKTSGVEVFLSADLTETLRLRADYTYTDAVDLEAHTALLRRPKNKASASLGWQATAPLLLTTTLLYTGERTDYDRFNYPNIVKLPDYALVNLAADYKIDQHVSLFGRIDNLFGKRYEDPAGYDGPGFAVFGGVRLSN